MYKVILHIDPVNPSCTAGWLAIPRGIGCALGEIYWQICGIPWDRLVGRHFALIRSDRYTVDRILPLYDHKTASYLDSAYDEMVVNLSCHDYPSAHRHAANLLLLGRTMGIEFIICSPVKLGRRRFDRHTRLQRTYCREPIPA